MNRIRRLLVAMGVIFGIIATEAEIIELPTQWTPSGLLNTRSHLADGHQGGGRWIVVGNHGTMLTTTDAKRWRQLRSITAADLFDIHYANDTWLVIGRGVVLHSSDGLHWEESTLEPALQEVSFREGTWVGLNEDTLYWSVDGKNWTQCTISMATDEPYLLSDLEPGETGWVVVGGFEPGMTDPFAQSMFMLHSEDGKTWRLVHRGNPICTIALNVVFGDGRWVAAGGCGDGRFSQRLYETWTSTNGMNWTDLPGNEFVRMRFGPDGWTAASHHNQTFMGDFYVGWESDDGLNWEQQGNLTYPFPVSKLISGEGQVLEIRNFSNNITTKSTIPSLRVFEISGQEIIPSSSNELQGPWFAGGHWSTASQGRILISSNGFRWEELAGPWRSEFRAVAIAHRAGIWLVLGVESDWQNVVYRSTDLVNWMRIELDYPSKTERTPASRTLVSTNEGFAIYASEGNFRTLPNGTVEQSGTSLLLESMEGLVWTPKFLPRIGSAMAYHDDTYIISTGQSHEILVSKGGSDWERIQLDGRGAIFNVVWGAGQWLAVGQGTFISPDGFEWTRVGNHPPFLDELSFVGSQWVASNHSHRVAVSQDGSRWSIQQFSGNGLAIGAIVERRGTFVTSARRDGLLTGLADNLHIPLEIKTAEAGMEVWWPPLNNSLIVQQSASINGPRMTLPNQSGRPFANWQSIDLTRPQRFFRVVSPNESR